MEVTDSHTHTHTHTQLVKRQLIVLVLLRSSLSTSWPHARHVHISFKLHNSLEEWLWSFPFCVYIGGPTSVSATVMPRFRWAPTDSCPWPKQSNSQKLFFPKTFVRPHEPQAERQPCSETGKQSNEKRGSESPPPQAGRGLRDPTGIWHLVCICRGSESRCLPGSLSGLKRLQGEGWERTGRYRVVQRGQERPPPPPPQQLPPCSRHRTAAWLLEPGAKWTRGAPCSKILIISRR